MQQYGRVQRSTTKLQEISRQFSTMQHDTVYLTITEHKKTLYTTMPYTTACYKYDTVLFDAIPYQALLLRCKGDMLEAFPSTASSRAAAMKL